MMRGKDFDLPARPSDLVGLWPRQIGRRPKETGQLSGKSETCRASAWPSQSQGCWYPPFSTAAG